MWGIIKKRLQQHQVIFSNTRELVEPLQEEWHEICPNMCQRLSDSMKERMKRWTLKDTQLGNKALFYNKFRGNLLRNNKVPWGWWNTRSGRRSEVMGEMRRNATILWPPVYDNAVTYWNFSYRVNSTSYAASYPILTTTKKSNAKWMIVVTSSKSGYIKTTELYCYQNFTHRSWLGVNKVASGPRLLE